MNIINFIVDYFLEFVLFSVVGWVYETVMYAFRDQTAVKRGFLFGPLCPIYGSGAVMCSVIMYGRISDYFAKFGDVWHIVALFFIGMILCSVLEYITSYVLEKAFHTRWWDYSYKTFQIGGRICLTSSLGFGVGVALLIKYVQPYVFYVFDDVFPPTAKYITAFVIYSILIIDVALTIQSLKDVVKALKEVEQYAVDRSQYGIDKAHDKISVIIEPVKAVPGEISDRMHSNERIDALIERLSGDKSLLSRAKKYFPALRSDKYQEAIDLLFPKGDEEEERKKKERKKKIRSGKPVKLDEEDE